MKKKVICSNCNEDTFLRVEPVYEGFKKVGEKYFCMVCGCEYEQDNMPEEVEEENCSLFSADDLEKIPDIFADDRDADNCSKCEYYIVNAFQQKCGITHEEVLATDICFNFNRKKLSKEEDDNEE